MRIHKKITAAMAALVMAFSTVPFSASAAKPDDEKILAIPPEQTSYSYFESIDEAGAYVREELKKHTAEFHIRLSRNAGSKDILNDVLGSAFAETGNPDEGEFLRLSIEGYNSRIGTIHDQPFLDIVFSYNATLEQDEAAKAKADELLAGFALDGKSEYDKIDAVYGYFITHVVYSEIDENNNFTAYGALVENDAVCQGYVQAMYYMLTASGVSTRAVMGKGKSDDHIWLIAGIDGIYYYLDPTWDSTFKGIARWFFLKGINDFDSESPENTHTAGKGDARNIAFIPDCTVENFLPDYPISEYRYEPSYSYITGDINDDGCIDVFDFIAIKQGLINGFVIYAAERAADVDGSGAVTLNDAVLLQKYLHGTVSGFSKSRL